MMILAILCILSGGLSAPLAWASPVIPSIDTPRDTGLDANADAAVVIANEQYDSLPHAQYALRDGEVMRDLFVHTLGIPKDRVIYATNADRDQMLSAIDRATALVDDSKGTLYVYYVGHGDAGPEGDPIFLGRDARRRGPLKKHWITLDDVLEHSTAAPHRIVIADTCFNGRSRADVALQPGARSAGGSITQTPHQSGAPTAIWMATSPGERAWTYDATQHGAFTYFVAGAIRGWADGASGQRKDKRVTLREAQAYVSVALAQIGDREQHPRLDVNAPDWDPQLNRKSRRLALEVAPPLDSFPSIDGQVPERPSNHYAPAVSVAPQAGLTNPADVAGPIARAPTYFTCCTKDYLLNTSITDSNSKKQDLSYVTQIAQWSANGYAASVNLEKSERRYHTWTLVTATCLVGATTTLYYSLSPVNSSPNKQGFAFPVWGVGSLVSTALWYRSSRQYTDQKRIITAYANENLNTLPRVPAGSP